jgi:MSHA pilin protein MshD
MSIRCRLHGMTLIELIVFIVIVGTALAGVLTVLDTTARSGGDPVIRKQMLAIAEGLLEEVALRPFTWCDPDDATAATATSATVGVGPAFCTATVEGMGPEAGETRTGGATSFDNVNDYAGLALPSPIASVSGSSFAPAGYSATVAVTQNSLNGIAATESLLIAVTVSRGADSLVLEGYRTRHSPNSLP